MQAHAEATQEAEGDATWYITELEAEIDKLRLDIKRLKSSQSFGYVRGRGLPNMGANLPKIDTLKPRVEALDVSPHDSPHG